jgi:hypothetical protein
MDGGCTYEKFPGRILSPSNRFISTFGNPNDSYELYILICPSHLFLEISKDLGFELGWNAKNKYNSSLLDNNDR